MNTFKHLTAEEVYAMIQSSDVQVMDIRDPQTFSLGHIPNAKSVNDDNIGVFLQEADKNKPVICCCYHGFSSQKAATFLVSQGFKEVYSMDGGYEGWKVFYA